MTNKRNLVMGIFLSLLIITLMTFSLTYARYTDELQSDGEISGDIEYIVSNQIEVDSVNSFISAIEKELRHDRVFVFVVARALDTAEADGIRLHGL